MVREVNLVSYLPPYLKEFKETAATLDAETPEFTLVWKAADRLLSNEFIETADEYGISRFEKLLGISPSVEDGIENRRARVFLRWFDSIPYTMRMLVQKLRMLCADTDFELVYDFAAGYTLTVHTSLERYAQVDELERLMDTMLPCNIVIDSQNRIDCHAEGSLLYGGGIVSVRQYCITDAFRDNFVSCGAASFGGGVVHTATLQAGADDALQGSVRVQFTETA